MKIFNLMLYDDNVFYQLVSINTSPMLEPFTIMKLDFLLLTKLVKIGTAHYQDMD